MFRRLSPPSAPSTAQINDQAVQVQPRETLLDAALREGLAFPHGCKVGGCGACKCKLQRGSVTELTETGYLLSGEELDEGYILACQSVPQGDVSLEVALPDTVGGEVLRQERLTHDIVRLHVQLDRPLAYRPGQHALVQLEGLEGVRRSYSFAAPPDAEGRVQFIIRHVPGGRFSTAACATELGGRRLTLTGPSGDFWLREDAQPAVFVAGGSGLAPVLAMLRAAAEAGERRPATLLFGARTQADLYALDEIAEIAARWQGPFTFVPVLSQAEDDADWAGARGMVTEHLVRHVGPGARAYLCGPPGMVDAAVALLRERGLSSEHIHFDRFTTTADVAPQERAPAGWLDYAKFGAFHLIGLAAAASLVAGQQWVVYGTAGLISLYVLGDLLLGDDTRTPAFAKPERLTWMLWAALPLVSLVVFAAVWAVSAGDPLGFGALVQSLTGFDALAAKAATTTAQHGVGVIMTGLMIGLLATIPAHELTHRTWDPVSLGVGRGLLAFSFDTIFSIEHVYGHHRYVSTTEDPATAPRGRNVYAHVLISTVRGNLSAWHIERKRLERKRLPVWSWHNAVLRGHGLSLALVGAAWAMGGGVAAAYFIACGLWGKALLEIVNYMEHYGMVRDPAEPVQPRHSWNTNRRVSSWTMFYLTRHSHHHAQGEVPFQDLRPMSDAPMMVSGYLTTLLIAMVPPLWHHLMTPKVLDWDARYASPRERQLAAEANARSGVPAMTQRVGAPQRSLA